MKSLMITVTAILFASLANAQNAELDHVREVKAKLSKGVSEIPGVNGIGIVRCDPKTGERIPSDCSNALREASVYCISIGAETQESLELLNDMYPAPTAIQGVFIVIEKRGPIEPQPRMTGGG